MSKKIEKLNALKLHANDIAQKLKMNDRRLDEISELEAGDTVRGSITNASLGLLMPEKVEKLDRSNELLTEMQLIDSQISEIDNAIWSEKKLKK